ncbi:hypothetical protein CQ12_37500 [Bradyrhizobium jicamae]|uniref:Uncharacterized protein n=1 Tax=Bradyrhizobium jicamae TaxID=280332 RepID=A0A0R3KMR3_9BRAD|nr:hypothetical protein CQ12_37500 [Bradyrhizobium jicamae]
MGDHRHASADRGDENDADPHVWLTQTLERIAQGWPISDPCSHGLTLQSLNGLSLALTLMIDAKRRLSKDSEEQSNFDRLTGATSPIAFSARRPQRDLYLTKQTRPRKTRFAPPDGEADNRDRLRLGARLWPDEM